MSQIKNLISIIGIFIASLYLLFDAPTKVGNAFVGGYILALVFVFCKCYSDYYELWLMGIIKLYFYYSMIINDYIDKGMRVPFEYYGNVRFYGIAIALLLLFEAIILLLMPIKKQEKMSVKDIAFNNPLVAYVFIFIQIYIIIFGFDRSVTSSYSVHISTLYEYLFIFIFISLLFAKDYKYIQGLIICISAIAIIQDMLFGGRITSLQIIIVFLLYYKDKMNNYKTLLGMAIGIILFTIVGIYRNRYKMSSGIISLIINTILKQRFALDTTYYAWYTSVVDIISRNVYSIGERVKNFYGFLLNIIGVHATNYSHVPLMATKAGLRNVGGSYSFAFFYFWFGILGVVVGACIYSLVFRMLLSGNSDIKKYLLVVLVSTSPRWILYTPLNFFRVPLLFLIAYIFAYCIDRVSKKQPLRITVKRRIR